MPCAWQKTVEKSEEKIGDPPVCQITVEKETVEGQTLVYAVGLVKRPQRAREDERWELACLG